MASINLAPVYPSAATNIRQEGDVNSVQLRWEASADLEDQYEVWTSAQNSLATATLAKTVVSNSHDQYIQDGLPVYSWIFTKNKYGGKSQTFGDAYSGAYLLPEYGRDNTVGSILKWGYLTLFATTTSPSTTVSIQYVEAKMYWTTAAGVDANSGWQGFLGAETAEWFTTNQGTAWVNPENTIVDDTSSATVNVEITKTRSDGLGFELFDFGIPDNAIFKGLEIRVKGKSSSASSTKLYAMIGNTYDADVMYQIPKNAKQLPVFTTNNVSQTLTLGGPTDTFYVGTGGLPLFKRYITPDQLTVYLPETYAFPNTYASASPTVTNYDEWYDCGSIAFNASLDYEYQFNNSIGLTISNVVSSGSDVLEILVRARVDYIPSDFSASFRPEPERIKTVLRTSGTSVFGSLQSIHDFHTSFRTGFRDIGVAGGAYRLVLEVIKRQIVGTPTCTVTVNFSSCTTVEEAGTVGEYFRGFKLP